MHKEHLWIVGNLVASIIGGACLFRYITGWPFWAGFWMTMGVGMVVRLFIFVIGNSCVCDWICSQCKCGEDCYPSLSRDQNLSKFLVSHVLFGIFYGSAFVVSAMCPFCATDQCGWGDLWCFETLCCGMGLVLIIGLSAQFCLWWCDLTLIFFKSGDFSSETLPIVDKNEYRPVVYDDDGSSEKNHT
jgi:hypothetical protein